MASILDDTYKHELQARIQELESENRQLKEEKMKLQHSYQDKLTQLAIRDSKEAMLKEVIARAIDGIAILDQNFVFVDANSSFCHSLQIERDELFRHSVETFINPEFSYKIEKLKHLLTTNGRAQGDLPFILKNGEERLFEFTATLHVDSELTTFILRDMTEKRKLESELKRSESKFREIFDNALDAIIVCEENGKIIRANQAASRMFELPLEQLLTKNKIDFLAPNQDLGPFIKMMNEKGDFRSELLFLMPNNEYKELEFTYKKDVLDGCHMTIYRNITERKKKEKEYLENELKFRKIFENAMTGIVLYDDNNQILDANSVACEILEIDYVNIKDRSLHSLICYDDGVNILNVVKKEEDIIEVPFILQSGIRKTIEFSAKTNIIPGVHMSIFRDITHKKGLEEKLRKSDTLNVVGELAAGIAHEIRNPMTALKGFIQLLQGSIKEDYSMYFDIIQTELKRIESIITEFLILSKPQAVQYMKKDVSTILKETIELLNPQALFQNVQIFQYTDANLPEIYCEPNQLKQVFINLLKNAIEIMPNGGTICTKISKLDDHHIEISVKDEGAGIPEDKIKKLGEPFYTTKERGTGLGLMVSYKIIKEHMGTVKVKSKMGIGTTFTITLPVHFREKEANNDSLI